jgi:hypothetical protein
VVPLREPKTKSEKLARALALRDIAVDVAKRCGTLEQHYEPDANIFTVQIGKMIIAYRIAICAGCADFRFPYGLDVWAPEKVLSIEWDDEGSVDLVNWRPGTWTSQLLLQ